MGFNAFTGEDDAQSGESCPVCGGRTVIESVGKGLNRNHMKCTSCDWGYISR